MKTRLKLNEETGFKVTDSPLGYMLKNKVLPDVYSHITYQVNSFIVQVGLKRFLELPDHGLHKLSTKVVVPGVEEAHQSCINRQLFWQESGAVKTGHTVRRLKWKTGIGVKRG